MDSKKINSSALKRLSVTAICVSLCVILPLILHSIPNAGKILSPMHIPILVCGLTCPWQYASVCGALGVILSSLITSMPAFALLPAMAVECTVYGLVSSLTLKHLRVKHRYAAICISLITAMIFGRIAGGIVHALTLSDGYTLDAWISAYFVVSLPGSALQLLIIPPIVRTLERARLTSHDNKTHTLK